MHIPVAGSVQALSFHSGPQQSRTGAEAEAPGGDGAGRPQVGQEQEEQKAGSSQDLCRVPKVNLQKASSGVRSKGREEGCGWERTRWCWNAVGAAGREMCGLKRRHGMARVPAAKVWSAWCVIALVMFLETRKHRPLGECTLGSALPSAPPQDKHPHQLLTEKRPCQ